MAVNSVDPATGRPIFLDTDAPDIKVDPTEAAKYAADVGNRIVRDNLAGLVAYPHKRKGLRGYAKDSGYEYVHDGNDWITAQAFVLIASQTLTAAGVANFDNVFSSRFRNYLIRVAISSLSGGGQVAFRMRLNGTPAQAANSYLALARSNGSSAPNTITGTSVTDTSGPLHKTNAGALYATLEMFDPAVAARTVALIKSHGVGGTTAAELGDLSVQHNPATAYDGFQLITSGVSMTGSVSVFGLG